MNGEADRIIVEPLELISSKTEAIIDGFYFQLPNIIAALVLLFHDQTEESDGDRRQQREGWPSGEAPPKPRWIKMRETDGHGTKDAERSTS